MKICGTVRRPVRLIICSRCAGSRSMRTLSISRTPRAWSSCSARTHQGHTAVQYISTRAVIRLPLPSLLDDRQPGLAPRLKPAAEVEHVLAAGLAQDPGGTARRDAAGTAQQHRLVRRQFADPLLELGH